MLRVQSLVCRRGGREIFRDVAFALNEGDVLLVSGANGSGKTSLLRMLAGLLPPADGHILWDEKNAAEDWNAYRKNLHYIGHLDAAKQELTVAEMLDYWDALYGLNGMDETVQDLFGIRALRDKPVRYLSAGQRRKLTLSRLACGHAPLWLLDEPMTALDQNGQDILFDCINRHCGAGGIAVIATHQDVALPQVRQYKLSGRSA